ncbi:Oxidoreductase molybdopterin binding domain-containing protein [Imperialibacter sp. EC-SDR9]|nr:Oxidoreductase molybdopterin binding domain-containing protein [Imperialibacter sp. 89]CAD5256444.1 Oxidoreductase molybdopterin binding domain-containing protein [Imperialibacter sp. 75]VVT20231.1 Oxidoreductase molybdopterin binding domain-containing protein [Imperialibacter sp. EC-SDR9]
MRNMKKTDIITRRKALAVSASALGALLLPGCSKSSPPTYGSLLRMGDALTYTAQRTLLPGQSLAKEYSFADISSFPATGTINPADSSKEYYSEEYERLKSGLFANWRLSVEGSVTNAGQYSLRDLQRFAARTQITRHTCEEGWTAIGEWTGVPLSSVLEHAGILPGARFINFYSYDGWEDSIDMLDAFHPQTILAYGMNGKALSVPHGAPVRLRVEKQIGYKSMKYLQRIVVTDEFVDPGDTGWAWYVGI